MNIAAPYRFVYSKSNASNNDLRKMIAKAIPISVAQSKQFSKRFKGKTDRQTAKNIYNFLKSLKYIKDGENQKIKTIRVLVKDGSGDCKSYTVATSAILKNLGIPHFIVYTSYNKADATPSHVYVQLKDGTIIDAVYKAFNKEAPYAYKFRKSV
jgi:transglutaminase-like putative cysteine protease